jgi:hypothetical protein
MLTDEIQIALRHRGEIGHEQTKWQRIHAVFPCLWSG